MLVKNELLIYLYVNGLTKSKSISFLYVASPDSLRRELQKAIETRNMAALEKAISQCEDAGHPELSSDLQDARDILENLSDGRGG